MEDSQSNDPRTVRIDAQIHAGEIAGGEVSAVRIEHAYGAVTTGYSAEQVSRLIDHIRQEFTPRPFSGECPYLGLETFQESDAGRFFGREQLVAQVLEMVSALRFIALAGPSGSGKSSLVRAGLLPVLKGTHPRQKTPFPESPHWLYATLRPGRQPLEALGRAVAALTGGLQPLEDMRSKGLSGGGLLADWLETALGDDPKRRLVLFVDQFEETFTQLPTEGEPLRLAFLDLLVQAASRPEGRTTVIVTLRSDFIANCAAYPTLNALLNAGFLQVGAMSAEELANAIARPAIEAGLPIEDELVRRIMNEMRDQPGGLPLMQFALRDLFTAQQARGGVLRLTLHDYLERGGLGQALERHAEHAFSRLSPEEQQLARWVFSGLVQPGRGAQDTARRARFEELAPAGVPPAEIENLIHKLADARLVTTEDVEAENAGVRSVSLAHERLLEAWSWLGRLVDENRQAITLANQIAGDAHEWDDEGRDPSYLYAGARLLAAEEAVSAGKMALSELGKAYIQAAAQRRDAERRAVRRRTQLLVIGLAAAAVVFAILGITSQFFRGQAESQAATAVYFQGVAETEAAISAEQRAIALTAEAEAQRQRDAAEASAIEAEKNARLALSRQLAARSSVEIEKSDQVGLLLAAASGLFTDTLESRTALLNGITRQPSLRRFLNVGYPLTEMIFSQSGNHLLVAGCLNPTASSCRTIFNFSAFITSNGMLVGPPLEVEASQLLDWAYHEQAGIIAIGFCQGDCSLSQLQVYSFPGGVVDGQSYRKISEFNLANLSTLDAIRISPDGTNVVTSGCIADADFNQQPGDEYRVCAYHQIDVWEIASSQRVDSFNPFEDHNVISGTFDVDVLSTTKLAYSPDGQRIVLVNQKENMVDLRMIDLKTHEIHWTAQLDGLINGLMPPLISPDGKILSVYGCRRAAVFESCEVFVDYFDLSDGSSLGSDEINVMDSALSGAFRSDNSLRLAGVKLDGFFNPASVKLWDEARWYDPDGVTIADGEVAGEIALSNSGNLLAVSNGGQVSLYDLEQYWFAGLEMRKHHWGVGALAFRPDGTQLAAGSQGNVVLWNREMNGEWKPALQIDEQGIFDYIPPEERHATAFDRGYKTTGGPIAARDPVVGIRFISFSKTGQLLATGIFNYSSQPIGLVRLWDLAELRSIQLQQPEELGELTDLVFCPDSQCLVALDKTGRVIVWDSGSGEIEFDGITFSPAWHVAISPNTELVAVAGTTALMIIQINLGENLTPSTAYTSWPISRLVFEPIESHLVIFGENGEIATWNPKSNHLPQDQIGNGINFRQTLLGSAGFIESEVISNDYLALHDTRSRQAIPVALWPTKPLDAYVISAAVHPSGGWAAIGLENGPLVFWSLRLEDWIADACRIANRELTEEEWRTYVGAEIPYQPVCGFGARN